MAFPDLDERVQDDKSRIQSIGKMVGILGCFSTVDRHLALGQIAAASSLPRPTAHRMLSTLREIGFIDQDRRTGNYSLGIRLFQLGSLALANLDLLREAKPFMDRLSRLTAESVHLGVFNGFEVIVVERGEPGDKPARGILASESTPAYCTGVGKALLAFQPLSAIDRVINHGLKPFTTSTIVDPVRLRAELALVRERGFAIDDCEHQIWVRCVSAPIRNSSGHVFASLSVTGAAERMTHERLDQMAPLVIQTADSVSRQLGYSVTL
jgi:DNA-binding IclR family transcriptional regulator